jgi:cephalosporin hydroxylase
MPQPAVPPRVGAGLRRLAGAVRRGQAGTAASSAAATVFRWIAPAVDAVAVRRVEHLVAKQRATGQDIGPGVEQAMFEAVALRARRTRVGASATDDRWAALFVEGFVNLYSEDLDSPPTPLVKKAIVDQFHRLYYHDRGTWRDTYWLGTHIWKCPLDLWLYQEMLYEVRPALIIETGTAFGGSASYLAHLCDIIGKGAIVSIDVTGDDDRPKHERVTYIHGSSTAPEVVAEVTGRIEAGEPVMVILDSDHSENHVYNELNVYADLVTVGSYLIVEDTNVNGHPAFPEHGPGPMEALDRFLAERSDFEIDETKHKFHMTFNPRGVLRKVR